MVKPLSSWPWENLGNFKYLLYGPLVAKVVQSKAWDQEAGRKDAWCLHILIICALRGLMHALWCSFCNLHSLTRKRSIHQVGVDFKQIDKEWHWDNFIILQAFMACMAYYTFPFLWNLPLWNSKGIIFALLLHVGVSEPLYYWIHRFVLHNDFMFKNYHSIHHASPVPQSFTAGHATPLEHLILGSFIGIPTLGVSLIGYGSAGMIYGYVLVFDFLRCMGHSNIEVVPNWIFRIFPFLRYLIYTPTYHSLHHKEMDSNFCLFMPLFDALWNTIHKKSWELHKKISTGINAREPDFVFLCHVVDVVSSMHAPLFLRSFVSIPFEMRLFLLPFWPASFLTMLILWAVSKTFVITSYNLRGRLHHSWCVPRYGFQYFLPFAKDGINNQIEDAILRADRTGVKVISLAALNKNEALNGGGTLFVKKLPNLRVRVVHGNTLTAAVIIKEIPSDVKEVFLTGATSKLGRAIALYLSRRKIRVLVFLKEQYLISESPDEKILRRMQMLTLSTERFQAIQNEAPKEDQSYLVQINKYEAAQHCKMWVVGKWLTPGQQRWAPPGTHFNQFVVPPIFPFRRDCTYGELAAMQLPQDVEGLGTCEYTMTRGGVHACHAGGIVHLLEGWTHHEVGAIDVDKIDIVWEAALKHGFKPVFPYP